MRPEIPDFYVSRADLNYFAENFDLAINDYKKAIEIYNDYDIAYAKLGDCYREKDDANTAIFYYKSAIKINPYYTYAHYSLGSIHLDLENYEEAIKSFNTVMNIDSTNYLTSGNLGWAYYCIDDFENCILYSRKAIELDNEAYFAKFNIALATLNLGETDDAKKLYKKYLSNSKLEADDLSGAIEDLNKLIEKGIMEKEVQEILKLYFNQ